MPSLLRRVRNNADLPAAFLRSWLLARQDAAAFDEIETYCMFVGHPRSGHSLVGSLLDAHPEAVISHELDALRYFAVGFRRNQVFSLILEKTRGDAETGRTSGVYAYAVPDQWQGRYERLRVLGDKKGGRSTRRMLQSPGLLGRARRQIQLPMRFVHVTRNPFDNIATMLGKKAEHATLDATIEEYFAMCEGVRRTHDEAPGEVIDMRHEDLLADPGPFLRRLCEFVGLKADDAYVDACAGILYDSPKRTRSTVEWSPAQIELVEQRIADFSFLRGYSFDS